MDILVVGTRLAGWQRYLRKASLNILLIEKSDQICGTASTSSETIWIPSTTYGRDAGYRDIPEAAATYPDELITTHMPRPRRQREVYLTRCGDQLSAGQH